MSHYDLTSALRPEPDAILQQIADYVFDLDRITSDNATDTAALCLMDTLGCGLLALDYPACVKMLGPIVPGATMQGGARVPGTSYELDPVQAAFNIGAIIKSGLSWATASIISCDFATTQTRISWPRSVNSMRRRWLRLLCAEVKKRTRMESPLFPGGLGWKEVSMSEQFGRPDQAT